jgi:hypothetical protein
MSLLSACSRFFTRIGGLFGRRQHPRRPSNLAVDWHLFGSKVGHISTLVDLSRGGAFVRAAYPRDVGSPIVLELPTADGPINVHARVAWSTEQGMGLRFTRLLPAQQAVFAAI